MDEAACPDTVKKEYRQSSKEEKLPDTVKKDFGEQRAAPELKPLDFNLKMLQDMFKKKFTKKLASAPASGDQSQEDITLVSQTPRA